MKVTFAGLLCILVVVLVGLAALSSETNLLFALFSIGLGTLLFSAIVPLLIVQRVDVERVTPQAVVAGREFRLVYTLRHRGRWGRAWSIVFQESAVQPARLVFPQGWFACLSAGQEERIEVACACPYRGRVRLSGVRLESRFPLGLFCCGVNVHLPAEMMVYPAVGRLRRDAWRGQRFSAGAPARTSRMDGVHEDFYGVREYRHGDNLRSIHWRRSAHTGQLVVRENTSKRATQVIVLLDPWVDPLPPPRGAARGGDGARPSPSAANMDSDGEQVIIAAATALCDALEQGHRAALIARGHRPVVIPAAGGRAHRQRLMHELSVLEPGGPESLDDLVARIRWTSGWQARCLLCTTRLVDGHQKVLRFLRPRAEAVIVAAPETPWFLNCFQLPGTGG